MKRFKNYLSEKKLQPVEVNIGSGMIKTAKPFRGKSPVEGLGFYWTSSGSKKYYRVRHEPSGLWVFSATGRPATMSQNDFMKLWKELADKYGVDFSGSEAEVKRQQKEIEKIFSEVRSKY